MIKTIEIKNYKSIVKLKLDLKRFNVMIGANGCGKSNILEAIALGAAANARMLEKSYLETVIRLANPRLMLPAFGELETDRISICAIEDNDMQWSHELHYDNSQKPARWIDDVDLRTQYLMFTLQQKKQNGQTIKVKDLIAVLEELRQDEKININQERETSNDHKVLTNRNSIPLSSFKIYSLDEYELRKYTSPGETALGIHGTGLFSYLKQRAVQPDGKQFIAEICEGLESLDWFDGLQIPEDELVGETTVLIKDKFLADAFGQFDQRSANEGFLYLLFYLTLIISDDTPTFFAIDNIDSAFNPKLCREVIKKLIALAKKHNKQIIATTHNPAVLDGMDLFDEEQNLLVAQRNTDGYTRLRAVKHDKLDTSLPLSQLWLRGFIGGLPNNF